jgi:hypothetical protein
MVKAKSSPDMMWDGCAAAHGRDTVSRHGSDAMSPEGSAPRADGSEAGCDRVAASWRHTSGAAGAMATPKPVSDASVATM